MKDKYIEDNKILNQALGNRKKPQKDGYYLLFLCDNDDIYNEKLYIKANNKELEPKDFEIFGKLEDGTMTELITGTVLKYIDDTNMIIENEESNNKLFKYVTHYHYETPCYLKAIQLYPSELSEKLTELSELYDVLEYKNKIQSQINKATNNYEEKKIKEELVIESFIEKHRTKNRMRI